MAWTFGLVLLHLEDFLVSGNLPPSSNRPQFSRLRYSGMQGQEQAGALHPTLYLQDNAVRYCTLLYCMAFLWPNSTVWPCSIKHHISLNIYFFTQIIFCSSNVCTFAHKEKILARKKCILWNKLRPVRSKLVAVRWKRPDRNITGCSPLKAKQEPGKRFHSPNWVTLGIPPQTEEHYFALYCTLYNVHCTLYTFFRPKCPPDFPLNFPSNFST